MKKITLQISNPYERETVSLEEMGGARMHATVSGCGDNLCATDAEAIRASLDRVAEMEEFWQFMRRTRRSLKPGSIEAA